MARHPSSVRPFVCKHLRKSLLLAHKWPDRHQTFTRWTPGQRASRMCSRSRSRSKITWYAHFLGFLEWATPSLTVWFFFFSVLVHVKSDNFHSDSVPVLEILIIFCLIFSRTKHDISELPISLYYCLWSAKRRVQQWRPETMTMTSTNLFSEDGMSGNSPWIWQFFKSTPLVLHIFLAVVHLVAVVVGGRHGIGLGPKRYAL